MGLHKRLLSAVANEKIFKHIYDNDTNSLEDAYGVEEDIKTIRSIEGWTSLHAAVILSRDTCVELLMRHVDPSIADKELKTALHWAAFNNTSFKVFSLICTLLKENLSSYDMFGRTPMHYICMNKTVLEGNTTECSANDIIDKLHLAMKLGSDVNARDCNGDTPLHFLCSFMHTCGAGRRFVDFKKMPEDLQQFKSKTLCGIMVEMFEMYHSDMFMLNDFNITPLHSAVRFSCVEMIHVYLRKEIPEILVKDLSITPFMCMAFYSHSLCESLQYTIVSNNIYERVFKEHEARFHDGLRPLLKALRLSVNKQNDITGTTVLHQAVNNGLCSSKVVQGLIGYGKANVNAVDFLGKPPLPYTFVGEAFMPGQQEKNLIDKRKQKLELLLKSGANVDLQDMFGNSALHDAAFHSYETEYLGVMTQSNANVHLRNKHGATPLLLLLINTRLENTNLERFNNTLELLLDKGANIHDTDSYGSSSLHYAISSGNKTVVTKILSLGVNTTIRDRKGLDASKYCELVYNVPLEKFLQHDFTVRSSNYFLDAIRIEDAMNWLNVNMEEKFLSDDKIIDVLTSSEKLNLSNNVDNNIVLKEVMDLMLDVFSLVEKKDPRFKVSIELAGSTREGTKVDKPDEFDLLCFLDNFENLFDIEELKDSSFVQCRKRESVDHSMYSDFFNDNNLLLGHKIRARLYVLIKQSLAEPSVWEKVPGLSAL